MSTLAIHSLFTPGPLKAPTHLVTVDQDLSCTSLSLMLQRRFHSTEHVLAIRMLPELAEPQSSEPSSRSSTGVRVTGMRAFILTASVGYLYNIRHPALLAIYSFKEPVLHACCMGHHIVTATAQEVSTWLTCPSQPGLSNEVIAMEPIDTHRQSPHHT